MEGTVEGRVRLRVMLYPRNEENSMTQGGDTDDHQQVRRRSRGESSGSLFVPVPTAEENLENTGSENSSHWTGENGSGNFVGVIGMNNELEEPPHNRSFELPLLFGQASWTCDTATVELRFSPGYNFYGVYDGHAGQAVAELCRDRLYKVMAEELASEEMVAAAESEREVEKEWWGMIFKASFAKVEGDVKAGAAGEAGLMGCSAVVAVVGPRHLVVGNCGDSRAVLSRGGMPVPLSFDHKPNRPDELARVTAAGGWSVDWNGWRVYGVLPISRAIGSLYFEKYVTSEPEVTVTYRTDDDEFIILANHALWNYVTTEEACQIVSLYLKGRLRRRFVTTEQAPGNAATLLSNFATLRGCNSDINLVLIVFKELMPGNNGA